MWPLELGTWSAHTEVWALWAALFCRSFVSCSMGKGESSMKLWCQTPLYSIPIVQLLPGVKLIGKRGIISATCLIQRNTRLPVIQYTSCPTKLNKRKVGFRPVQIINNRLQWKVKPLGVNLESKKRIISRNKMNQGSSSKFLQASKDWKEKWLTILQLDSKTFISNYLRIIRCMGALPSTFFYPSWIPPRKISFYVQSENCWPQWRHSPCSNLMSISTMSQLWQNQSSPRGS